SLGRQIQFQQIRLDDTVRRIAASETNSNCGLELSRSGPGSLPRELLHFTKSGDQWPELVTLVHGANGIERGSFSMSDFIAQLPNRKKGKDRKYLQRDWLKQWGVWYHLLDFEYDKHLGTRRERVGGWWSVLNAALEVENERVPPAIQRLLCLHLHYSLSLEPLLRALTEWSSDLAANIRYSSSGESHSAFDTKPTAKTYLRLTARMVHLLTTKVHREALKSVPRESWSTCLELAHRLQLTIHVQNVNPSAATANGLSTQLLEAFLRVEITWFREQRVSDFETRLARARAVRNLTVSKPVQLTKFEAKWQKKRLEEQSQMETLISDRSRVDLSPFLAGCIARANSAGPLTVQTSGPKPSAPATTARPAHFYSVIAPSNSPEESNEEAPEEIESEAESDGWNMPEYKDCIADEPDAESGESDFEADDTECPIDEPLDQDEEFEPDDAEYGDRSDVEPSQSDDEEDDLEESASDSDTPASPVGHRKRVHFGSAVELEGPPLSRKARRMA
ncbi:MAG: hypothetical protein P4M11_00025, partial [Candidatus Pacebacteria bacterium]|nr:hypothetical protein [Candidatus Paceibacterota bacterium]